MWEWLIKKVFTPQRCGVIVKNMLPYIKENAKDFVFEILEDEEIAGAVRTYGDTLFNHYKKMFFGTIGGMQKGLNYQAEELNPLAGIIDEDGHINLMQLVKTGFNYFRNKGKGNNGFSSQRALPSGSGSGGLQGPR